MCWICSRFEILLSCIHLFYKVQESDVVVGIQIEDEVAFEAVFKTYYSRLCNYAHTMLNDSEEAEEMVQNTFIVLWENRANVDIHTSLKSYLYRAVHNSCLNRIKHLKVRQEHSDYYMHTHEEEVDTTAHTVMGNELQHQINEAVDLLPPQCKRVFTLSRFENLTYAEIAIELGVSVKAVDKQMVRALRILREQLKDYLPLVLLLLLFKK